jgi:hypothetical protein
VHNVERRKEAEDARFEEERRQAREKLPPGSVTHVSAIAPQIQRLRQDHLAAVHARPHQAFYRQGLIAAALQMVASRSFFHREVLEHEPQKHDA